SPLKQCGLPSLDTSTVVDCAPVVAEAGRTVNPSAEPIASAAVLAPTKVALSRNHPFMRTALPSKAAGMAHTGGCRAAAQSGRRSPCHPGRPCAPEPCGPPQAAAPAG